MRDHVERRLEVDGRGPRHRHASMRHRASGPREARDAFADIHAAKADGRIALVAALEASTMIENDLDRIEVLYGFGVRQMGIAYSEANCLGAGLKERRDGGLTAFGRAAVERMNKVGMSIDVSHSGDVTSMDTIDFDEADLHHPRRRARRVGQ